MCKGKMFHILGAATENARSPLSVRLDLEDLEEHRIFYGKYIAGASKCLAQLSQASPVLSVIGCDFPCPRNHIENEVIVYNIAYGMGHGVNSVSLIGSCECPEIECLMYTIYVGAQCI